MILGVDLGNENIKTSEGIIFKSKITEEEGIFTKDIQLEFNDKKYILGEGQYQTDINKVDKENFLPMLLGAIALSSKHIENRIVLGLPIGHFKSNKQRIKDLIMNNRINNVTINGDKKQIIITDVEVFPEALGAYFYSNIKEDVIIVDIGGRTTDIAFIQNNKVKQHQTLFVGMLNIYNDIIKSVNEKFTLNLDLEYGEKILKQGLTLHGEKQNLSFIKPILKNQLDKIFKELNINFPVNTENVVLTGGGSYTLEELFKRKLKNVEVMKDALFANSKGFKKVGESLWH